MEKPKFRIGDIVSYLTYRVSVGNILHIAKIKSIEITPKKITYELSDDMNMDEEEIKLYKYA